MNEQPTLNEQQKSKEQQLNTDIMKIISNKYTGTNIKFTSNMSETKLNKMLMLGMLDVIKPASTIDTDNIYVLYERSTNTTEIISTKQLTTPRDSSELMDEIRVNSIDMTDVDTSHTVVMDYMFSNKYIKKLNLSTMNTSNVKSMYAMFKGLKLDKLDLRSFDTSKVTNMSDMFFNANIKEIDLTSFRADGLAYSSNMFEYAVIENMLDLSSFDMKNVRKVNRMFKHAKIKEIILCASKPSKILTTETMFYCSIIDRLDLSNFYINEQADTDWMFDGSTIKSGIVHDEEIRHTYLHRDMT